MSRSMTLKLAMFASFTVMALLVIGEAQASVCTLAGPNFVGSFTVNPGGTSLGPGDCTSVVQQDKTYSNFVFPSGTTVLFGFSNVSGVDHHSLTFGDNFGGAGTSTSWSYDISVSTSLAHFLTASASMSQTAGSATLTKNLLDNNSNPYTIKFQQTNASTVIGVTSVSILPGATTLHVSDTLKVGPSGSDVTTVQNSFTESLVTPEPASLALMGTGLLSIGALVRRRRKLS